MSVMTLLGVSDMSVELVASPLVVRLTSSALEYGDVDMPQPTTTTPVAAGASPATIKNAAGFLYGVVITQMGTAEVLIQDGGPSGTTIAVIPPNHPIGDLQFGGGSRPFQISLFVGTGSGSPAFTLLYS